MEGSFVCCLGCLIDINLVGLKKLLPLVPSVYSKLLSSSINIVMKQRPPTTVNQSHQGWMARNRACLYNQFYKFKIKFRAVMVNAILLPNFCKWSQNFLHF